MNERLEAVCDLLMGAAYADDSLHIKERKVVEECLKGFFPDGEITPELRLRMNSFAPEQFEVKKVASLFSNDERAERLRLLGLVAAVHSSDNEYDFAEDDYLHAVATAMSLDDDDTKEHALMYEFLSARETNEGVGSSSPPPPPLPIKFDD